MGIQKELLKLIPNDPVIKEFSKFLPTEIEYQQDAEDEVEENKIEYYDEEISDPEDKDCEEESDEENGETFKTGSKGKKPTLESAFMMEGDSDPEEDPEKVAAMMG